MNVNSELNKDKFIHDLKAMINPLYQIAYNQGFHEWTYNISNKDIIRLDKKVEKYKGQIEKYGYLGIVLFVGIPLPGTGAWTGSLIACVLEMDRKKTFLAVLAGVFLASIIMMLVSFGLVARVVG